MKIKNVFDAVAGFLQGVFLGRRGWCVGLWMGVWVFAGTAFGQSVLPPEQPALGPGGADYRHGGVRKCGPFGSGGQTCWIFEPAAPVCVTAPIVVFLHGYGGVESGSSGAWISHLVRKGHIVIFPLYQTDPFGLENYTRDAMVGVRNAWKVLAEEAGHPRPDPEGRWAVLGYSLGASIGANLCAMAEKEGLPVPRALMACNAGDANVLLEFATPVLQSPSEIPDLFLLVVAGAEDRLVGETVSRAIFEKSVRVQPRNKNLIRLESDSHGQPGLVADHFAPVCPDMSLSNFEDLQSVFSGRAQLGGKRKGRGGRADALDYYGYWKWMDALIGAAFHGNSRDAALGNTPAQRFMGVWSDGTPVREPMVEEAQ
jgi:hypothetical protein